MTNKILETLASSLPVQQLLKSEAVTQALGNILNLRNSVEEFLEEKIRNTLNLIEVPSRKELNTMEKKIHQLETELMSMHRRALIKKLKTGSPKKASASSPSKGNAKKATRKKK